MLLVPRPLSVLLVQAARTQVRLHRALGRAHAGNGAHWKGMNLLFLWSLDVGRYTALPQSVPCPLRAVCPASHSFCDGQAPSG